MSDPADEAMKDSNPSLHFSLCHMLWMRPFVLINLLCLLNLAAISELGPDKFTDVHKPFF